jgi:hypothetical protein
MQTNRMSSEGWRVMQCPLAEAPFGVDARGHPLRQIDRDAGFLADQNFIGAEPNWESMTDRRFYLLLTLLILALAGGKIVYAVLGPFSAPTQLIDEFGSRNRVR